MELWQLFPTQTTLTPTVLIFSQTTWTKTFCIEILYTLHKSLFQYLLSWRCISKSRLRRNMSLFYCSALRPSRGRLLNSTPNRSPRSSMVNINKLNMNRLDALQRQTMEKKFLTLLIAVRLVFALCYRPQVPSGLQLTDLTLQESLQYADFQVT